MTIKKLNGQAACTKPGISYPGYINVTRDCDNIIVTVRGDARGDSCGPIVSLPLTLAQWRAFLSEVETRI